MVFGGGNDDQILICGQVGTNQILINLKENDSNNNNNNKMSFVLR